VPDGVDHDGFIGETRAAGVDETRLAHIDPTNYKPLIEMGVRAFGSGLGEEIGVAYAKAFRYERVEVPKFFKQGERTDEKTW
jgi:transketolase N-terminal domain/subunit